MGIPVDWVDIEKKIIRYDFPVQWSWDDLYDAVNQVNTMLATVPHTVYVVISVERSKGLPPGALTHLRLGTLMGAPNWGGGVFIGVSSLLSALLNTFTTVNKKLGERYATAKTYEEAIEIINKWRMKDTT